MRSKLRILLLWLVAVFPQAGFASPQDAERFAHIAGLNLADYFSFDDLANKFGKSKVAPSGNGEDPDARTCYKTSDGKMVVIFFEGEVDLGFTVRYPEKMDEECPKSPALTPSLTNVAGISLGMSEAEYKALLGEPAKVTANHMNHTFHHVHRVSKKALRAMAAGVQKNGSAEEEPGVLRSWEVSINLDASFTHGRLTSFTVDRTEHD